MNADTVEINTIEELTIHALEHTSAGIETLAADVRRCSRALIEEDPAALQMLAELVANLRDFDVFEHELCDFFQIDRNTIQSDNGTLGNTKDEFKLHLHTLLEKLERTDMLGLAQTLTDDLAKNIASFKSFIPLLKDHIQNEYVDYKG